MPRADRPQAITLGADNTIMCGAATPFGMPVSQSQAGVDQKAMAVLHQTMTHEQTWFPSLRPSDKPGIRVARARPGIDESIVM
ncbi:hypothetical protein X758_29710 [Mesorhizobium sp. LSHC416B00]|nr:hypothetical protein X761_30835 [Mesorhizobium sp. LSHC424B00]ESX65333.1 hypothetical protein X758_29710 [Mesorhizobium sp. LSHC416B00]